MRLAIVTRINSHVVRIAKQVGSDVEDRSVPPSAQLDGSGGRGRHGGTSKINFSQHVMFELRARILGGYKMEVLCNANNYPGRHVRQETIGSIRSHAPAELNNASWIARGVYPS